MAVRENYDDNKTVKGTSAVDSIVNGGYNVSITAGNPSQSARAQATTPFATVQTLTIII